MLAVEGQQVKSVIYKKRFDLCGDTKKKGFDLHVKGLIGVEDESLPRLSSL
jgi:hypothetical protein